MSNFPFAANAAIRTHLQATTENAAGPAVGILC